MSFIAPQFNSHFNAHFNAHFCAPTWNFCNKASAEKLKKSKRKGYSVVFRGKRTPYEEFLSVLGRITLLEQRLHKILCTVYKLVNHDTNPESLSELISPRETTYALRGKDSSDIANS